MCNISQHSTSLNINKQLRRLSTRCLANDATRFGQAVEGHSGIMAAASPLDLESPSSSSGASGAATSPLLLGCCRVCRKNIEAGEKHNYCDTCNQPVCEDCSSYSNIQAGEVRVNLKDAPVSRWRKNGKRRVTLKSERQKRGKSEWLQQKRVRERKSG